MKAATILLVAAVVIVFLILAVGKAVLHATRKHFDNWHPAEVQHKAGHVYYWIEKYGQEPILIAEINHRDMYYDEKVSAAESESISKCISLNTSKKTLERYKP